MYVTRLLMNTIPLAREDNCIFFNTLCANVSSDGSFGNCRASIDIVTVSRTNVNWKWCRNYLKIVVCRKLESALFTGNTFFNIICVILLCTVQHVEMNFLQSLGYRPHNSGTDQMNHTILSLFTVVTILFTSHNHIAFWTWNVSYQTLCPTTLFMSSHKRPILDFLYWKLGHPPYLFTYYIVLHIRGLR
jgi:hypothetical protein